MPDTTLVMLWVSFTLCWLWLSLAVGTFCYEKKSNFLIGFWLTFFFSIVAGLSYLFLSKPKLIPPEEERLRFQEHWLITWRLVIIILCLLMCGIIQSKTN